MGFEVIDRRGEKKVVEEPKAEETPEAGEAAVLEGVKGPAAVERRAVRGEILSWKSLGFTLVYIPAQPQALLSGRAVGMRTDERVFTADWLLPPVWEEELSWQKEARKRLETFRGCSCDRDGRCKFHGEMCGGRVGPGKWIEDDIRRLNKVQSTPLPECIEVLMRAEMARQQAGVIVPKG